MVYFKETIIFQVSRGGGQTFSRWSNIFLVQFLIPMETYRTCDFPGWLGLDTCPLLDQRMSGH